MGQKRVHPIACPVGGAEFDKLTLLRSHIAEMIDEQRDAEHIERVAEMPVGQRKKLCLKVRDHECEVCGKAFKKQKDLENHVAAMHGAATPP